ncbi:MAG: T9SS type A sorting domain-containing protein [Saprospiraceae bacterium]|nr:T9SS type A sorting domain-containing protein [Saprospiraceae bacterium]
MTYQENQEFQALFKRENKSRSLDGDYDLEKLVIYPNPSSGVFQLSNQVNWLESKICVYNQEGKQVYTGSISDQPIDLLFLGSGDYYLTVEKVNTLKVAKLLITK